MPYNSLVTRSDAQSLVREDVAAEIIQGAIENSVVFQLGTQLPDMSNDVRRMPVLENLPTAYFVDGDTGLKQTTKMAWANKYIYAEELAVIVPIPERVIRDSSYDLWAQIRPQVERAFGVAIDSAVLFGTNKPADWPNGIVTEATNKGNVVSLAAHTDLYEAVFDAGGLWSKVEDSGFDVTGMIARTQFKAKVRGQRDANGNPLFVTLPGATSLYEFDGVPTMFVKRRTWPDATKWAVAGDFSELVYAFNQRISWKVFDQGVIQDGAGEIVFNLMQQDMVALRAVMILGWQIPNPINDEQMSEGNRYPFAVLTD